MKTTPRCQPPTISFEALYHAYSPALFALLLKLVGHPERAEDLLHDAFIKIWTRIHRFDPQQGGLYNWVITIARNVAMDELRHRKVQWEASTYINDRDGEEEYPGFGEQLSGEHLYSLLPVKYGQVLELAYTQGLTQPEIAQALDLPLGTVKTRCRVGLQKLQAVFSQDIHQYQLVR
ncbi:RNA polymerase sigma factor [Spirosoma fluminis]